MRIASSSPFKEFAEIHSLVHNEKFHDEAHAVVRGVTLSTHRKDRHYTLGNINGHDITLLERTVNFQKPGRDAITLKWAILHNRLEIIDNLPHVFLDGNNRYHEDVYEEVFTKFSRLILAPAPHETPFMNSYRIFCNPETIISLPSLLDTKLTDKLSTLGHNMDYEILDNRIYIYLPTSAESTKDLEMMISALKIWTEWLESLAVHS